MNILLQTLSPGLVVIKRALPLPQQVSLAKKLLAFGEDPHRGFYNYDSLGQRTLNSQPPYRGRMFDHISAFPKELKEIAEMNLKRAQGADSSLKFIEPTHLIALFYKTLGREGPPNGYIPWHRDNGDNDGKGDFPVVSLSLGDSCDFLVCHNKPKLDKEHLFSNPANLAHRILFESGDAIIFGGPARLIYHAIYHIHPRTAPHELPFADGRINLTFRYAPEIIGQENEFKTIPQGMPKNNRFYRLS